MNAIQHLLKNSPEAIAVEAGEVDAVIDYSRSNVFVLPAARRALRIAEQEDARIANRLLAALPRVEYRDLLSGLEPLTLRSGEVLHEADALVEHVYFPVDCVVALLAALEDGKAVEVGQVGYEGMVGISLVLGVEHSGIRSLVQTGGTALRMKAARFSEALDRCAPWRRGMHRYAYSKLTQARRAVGCAHAHTIQARLARWLLMTGDRVKVEAFYLTQSLLGQMLGVRRATINEAAGALQQLGLIRYRRGNVRILDRRGLEGAACSCYARAIIR